MNYYIEDLLFVAGDLQNFPHKEDNLDAVVEPFLTDELSEDDLEYAAAAGTSMPSFQSFQHKYLKK